MQATYLAGTLYEAAMKKNGQKNTCRGSNCFQAVFLINAGLATVAVVTSVLLWRRTKHLYVRIIELTKTERKKRGLQVPLTYTPFWLMSDL